MKVARLVLGLFLIAGIAHSKDIKKEDLVKKANEWVAAIDALDYKTYQSLKSDELLKKEREAEGDEHPKEEKSDRTDEENWKAEIEEIMEVMGKFQKVELLELDPPDGAFFRVHMEHGSGELFLVLNDKGEITEENMRILEHPEQSEHPEEGDEHPEEGTKQEEHPKEDAEHPEQPEQDAKKKAEHPEHPDKEAKQRGPTTIESVATFLEGYSEKKTAEHGGWMKIHDEKAVLDLDLKLDKIHRERLAKTGEDTYFVCADFKTPAGKIYDLDFWVKDSEDGLSVTETTIHKEEGKARYNWIEENGIWKHKPL